MSSPPEITRVKRFTLSLRKMCEWPSWNITTRRWYDMRKDLAMAVIAVVVAMTTAWSISMLSRPNIAKAETEIGGGGELLPTRMTPLG